jgi:rSAM/selenodomain-associated transferase 1
MHKHKHKHKHKHNYNAGGRPIVAVFAKAPVPGQVKTRLIPRLGAAAAAQLHMQMAQHTLATLALARVGPVELWCTATGDLSMFEACRRKLGVPVRMQPEGDLGQRMSVAMADLLTRAPSAIIVGTDCPTLSPGDLTAAREALAGGYEAVLGPAADGGYYLLGLNHHHPSLFEGIDWGTPAVLEQARARLSALGWKWQELPTRWDVDTPDDYDRLLSDGRFAALVAPIAYPSLLA